MNTSRYHQLKDWYETHEKPISIVSLLAGFVLDSLTLHIDGVGDNIWLAINIIGVAACIILLNRQEVERSSEKHFWFFNIMQFGLGNILGGFFILYFRSGSLATSWPFLFIILIALVANVLFQKSYPLLVFQISFLYLSIFSFFIYLIPILLHSIGPIIFLVSGALSLLFLWFFTHFLKRFARQSFEVSSRPVWRTSIFIFIAINIFYFTNLIPPIPLSLKDYGLYHSLERDSRGGYVVSEEKRGAWSYFHLRETVHLTAGDSLYAYSAIFSPTDLNTEIIHEWQYQDEKSGAWVTASKIPLKLSGGRAEGFRTYSVKSNLAPGLWRINVATPRGQLIGRVGFRIVRVPTTPVLTYQVKK